jgi:hypothetical protein
MDFRVPRVLTVCPTGRLTATTGELAAKIMQAALGIESDEVANYVFPKTWPQVEIDLLQVVLARAADRDPCDRRANLARDHLDARNPIRAAK